MEGNNQGVLPKSDQAAQKGSSFNLKWLVSTVLAIWPWLLGSIIVSLIAGNLYLRYTLPTYSSYAKLLIADSKGGSSSGGGDVADMLKMNSKKINIENEIEIIKSRKNMLNVVSELHLNVIYSIVGRLKTTQLYTARPFEFTILDSIDMPYSCKVNIVDENNYIVTEPSGKTIHGKWDGIIDIEIGRAILRKTQFFNTVNAQYTINVSTRLDAAMNFMVNIFPPPGKGSSFITLTMLDAIPERSVDIINKLMEVYAMSNIQIRNRISDSTMNFITRRIKIVDSELTIIEEKIEEFKQSHGIANLPAQSAQLVEANTETLQNLAAQEYELAIIESVSNNLSRENERDERPIILPASLLSNTGLSKLLENYAALKIEIENSLIVNTPDNPTTRTLIKQRGEVRQNIISSLASSKKELQLKVNNTKRELGIINGDIRDVPKIERLSLEYSRQQALKQEIFIFLLKKREEIAIEKAATVSDATPIDAAITTGIVLPNRSRVLMLSFLLGLVVPFGIILLRRALNVKIINKEDIIEVTSIPIIGEIGNNSNVGAIAVKKNSRTIVSEQFRALRTNMQYILTNKQDKVLMITSSMSGEGKSFMAINLSITLAMSGKRVVLMELDLRKPKISSTLGTDNSVGFSSYCIEKTNYEDIIIPSGIEPKLYLLPSGPIPPNPSELILLQRTEDLFQKLRNDFDYIVIDTSPVGLVTDAQLLYKYADTALYIVRQGHTYKQQLNIPKELHESGKIPRISLIINDVVANRGFAYGYGYQESYGYGYGYGSYGGGYYVESTKKGLWERIGFKRKA